MRRALVLTDEAARHPFLASLPPSVRRTPPPRGLARLMRRSGIGASDLRQFAAAYCACLLAVVLFIF